MSTEDFERNEVTARMEPPPQWTAFEDYLREMVAEALHQRMWSEDPTNVLPPLRSDAPP